MRTTIKLGWLLLLGTTFAATGASAEPRNLKALVRTPTPQELLPPVTPPGKSQTLPDSVVVVTGSDADVKRMPGTKLALEGNKTTHAHVYQVNKGRFEIIIPDTQKNQVAVLVVGPRGQSAVVSGGHATAYVDDDSIRFTADGFGMLTGKGSRWKKLSSGMVRKVNLQSGASTDTTMMSAPDVDVAKPLAWTLSDKESTASVSFKALAHAERYQVALLRKEGTQLSLVSSTITPTAQADLSGVTPGNYLVLARGIDETGAPGPASAVEPLRVMGIELPPGAEATDSAILLPPSQRVPLVAADGLKMTYGSSNYFVDAPNTVGLARGATTKVRFREANSDQELELTLAPHTVNADVNIGPQTARWPRDAVTVKIGLTDATGQPLASDQKVSVEVSINLQQQEVQFKRTAAGLEGKLQPPKGSSGPWVVRVEVKDPLGRVAGHNFLEVVSGN
ncbi:MAG TPA: hypothetical protein VI197_21090 [Polyangiaceae bacterium]